MRRASVVLHHLDLKSCAHTVVSGNAGGASSSSYSPHSHDDIKASTNETVYEDKGKDGDGDSSSTMGGSTMGSEGGQISGGQLRRLTVGLELLRSPHILFLDEPTSGLDRSLNIYMCLNPPLRPIFNSFFKNYYHILYLSSNQLFSLPSLTHTYIKISFSF